MANEAAERRDQVKTFRSLPQDTGTYVVTTSTGTVYVFELSSRKVTRTPGPGSSPGPNDGVRTLRSVESCAVGSEGYWTMIAGDPLIDHYWQSTSRIISIVDAAPHGLSRPNEPGGAQL